jgi:putative spermidine/putrescine transport system ATP-binding protein
MAFLELEGVVKRFGRNAVVDGFNLAVEEGEFVSFLGGSGCGKTTTLRMIAGFESPTEGSIRIGGADIVPVAPNRRGVGMVFQNYALFPNMTVRRNIEFGLKVARWRPREAAARVTEMLALIHMEDLGERYPHQMSGGQQQRAALARALAVKPKVLLLDEPLSALDAKIRAMLRTEIRAIQQKTGITTIYVTHDQEEALSLSDRIVVMQAGRIEQVGTPFEIYNRPATPFVASFIGNLNILDAGVLDAAAGLLSVAGQEVRAAVPVSAPGASVRLSLRPEMLSLDAGIPGANQLTGTLASIVFLGSIIRLGIAVGDQTLSLDRFNAPHLDLPALGSSVTISFPREACLIS